MDPLGISHLHPKSPQHPCIQLARKVRKNVRNAFTRARNTRTAGQVSNAAGTERTQGDGLTAMIGDCFKTGERTHKKSISRIRGHCCMHHRSRGRRHRPVLTTMMKACCLSVQFFPHARQSRHGQGDWLTAPGRLARSRQLAKQAPELVRLLLDGFISAFVPTFHVSHTMWPLCTMCAAVHSLTSSTISCGCGGGGGVGTHLGNGLTGCGHLAGAMGSPAATQRTS